MLEWKAQGIPFDLMQVLVSDYPAYLPYVKRIFQESGIPVHLDHNRMIADYPAAQGVLYFLRFQEYGAYDDLLSALKSGYFRVSQSAIDRLEINVRQRGWTRYQNWQHEILVKAVAGEEKGLGDLISEGSKRRKRARVDKHWERLRAILKKTGYYDRFQKHDKGMETEGLRLEHQSIWRGFQAVIEQMTAMYGDQAIRASRFRELFALGCALVRVGLLPALTGQVTVRDFVRSRSMEKRCTVFLGMNEGLFPVMETSGGFFDFEEREWLADHDLKMGNTRRFHMQMQDLAFYQAIGKSRDQVLFLWSRKDANYDDLTASGRLIDLEDGGFGIPAREVRWQDLLTTGGQALRFCRKVFRRIGDGKFVSPDQREEAIRAYNRLNPKARRELRTLLHYGNQVLPLEARLADALYQSQETSITELELFNQCPFAHFLAYGIQPRELKPYRIDDPDVGQVLHDLMEMGYERHLKGHLSLERLDEDVSALCQPYFEAYRDGLFFTSQTNQYIGRQIRLSIIASLRQLILQKDQSLFEPAGQEMRFGNQPGDMAPLTVSLASGRSISVCGRVDRVDLYRAEDAAYIQVIDYKSGRRPLDKAEMVAGLHLQLPTYLNVCLSHYDGALAGGFFHYYLDRPLPVLGSWSGLKEQMRDFYRMRGFFLEDAGLVTAMDRSILDTGVSRAVAVRLKKDGSMPSTSQMLGATEMAEILERNGACIEKSVQDIYQGEIAIHPYENAGKDACSACAYGAICQFDPLFEGNEKRSLTRDQKEEVDHEVDRRATAGDLQR
jgi:ATP-dependent helicase/nuclease subunit B